MGCIGVVNVTSINPYLTRRSNKPYNSRRPSSMAAALPKKSQAVICILLFSYSFSLQLLISDAYESASSFVSRFQNNVGIREEDPDRGGA
jgi:hypothetical protein